MSNEKIINRIEKLLALAKSSNKNEAEAAMLKAQELLAKHKLTLADIEGNKKDIKVDIKVTDFYYTSKTKWKCLLAKVIADNFGCYCYTTLASEYNMKKYCYEKINKISFLGKDEDVNICLIVYEYALNTVLERIKEETKIRRKNGVSAAGLATDFGFGFTAGLEAMYKEQVKSNSSYALVVVKEAAVEEAYKNMNFTKGRPLSQKVNGRSDGYAAGYKAGKNFSASNRIANV